MDFTNIKDLFRQSAEYAGKEITVGGWVKNNRASKAFGFLVVSDGTFFEPLQIVYDEKLANFAAISKLNVGTAVIVRGTLVMTPDAKQPFELQAAEVVVEGASTPDYPLQKKRHSPEFLRTITHLRPARICSRRYSAFALWRHSRSTNSSRREASCMYTPRSSQAATVRVRARCSR